MLACFAVGVSRGVLDGAAHRCSRPAREQWGDDYAGQHELKIGAPLGGTLPR